MKRPAGGVPIPGGPFDERWYPFAPGTAVALTVRDPGTTPDQPARVVGAWARSLRADHVVVVTPARLEPGAEVSVPLQTVDAETVHIRGEVESCTRPAPGEHRTHIRFDQRINPARFAVCWGVVIDADGSLIEITALSRQARPFKGRLRTRRCGPDTRCERAENIATIANELARRAADGAPDAELREIAALLQTLLEPDDRADAA